MKTKLVGTSDVILDNSSAPKCIGDSILCIVSFVSLWIYIKRHNIRILSHGVNDKLCPLKLILCIEMHRREKNKLGILELQACKTITAFVCFVCTVMCVFVCVFVFVQCKWEWGYMKNSYLHKLNFIRNIVITLLSLYSS